MKKTIIALALVAGLTSFAGNTKAAVLFQDNFSGYSLDYSKWNENDTYVWGGSSAVVNNGFLNISYRPILTTIQGFSSPFNISGSFSLGTQSQPEALQIITRADGNTIGRWAEPVGLKFKFSTGGVNIQFADDGGNYTDFGSTTGLSLNNNTFYNYSIIDAGSSASVIINGVNVLSTSISPSLYAGNLVSITDRERSGGTVLGPITISTQSVPEPSTYALFGIGAMGLLMVMRRKKTA
jgi:hypothetical protein